MRWVCTKGNERVEVRNLEGEVPISYNPQLPLTRNSAFSPVLYVCWDKGAIPSLTTTQYTQWNAKQDKSPQNQLHLFPSNAEAGLGARAQAFRIPQPRLSSFYLYTIPSYHPELFADP
jgi:hypothetical protein